MKKVMMAVAVCLTMTACEKAIVPENVNESEWGGQNLIFPRRSSRSP